MGYLNEAGLARYDDLIKSWVLNTAGTVQGVTTTLNWQKTAAAGAVTCWPVPVSPLKPNVSFLFTETPPANGEPKAPDNPSAISGVSGVKVTRCGKNLCPLDKIHSEGSTGLTIAVDESGEYINVSGTASSDASIYLRTQTNNNNVLVGGGIRDGETYTFSFLGTAPSSGISFKLYIKATSSSSWSKTVDITCGNNATYAVPADTFSAMLRLDIASGTTLDCRCYVQVEEGSTATAFEPYAGADYAIALGSTYYGGSLDVASGKMTVTHVMVEPDSLSYDISAHPADTGDFQYADTLGRTVTTDGTTLTISDTTGGQIVYNLATPETVQLTATQIYSLSQSDEYTPRLNTIYSDQQSVQVGYAKSPIYSESELTNAIISLGGNI